MKPEDIISIVLVSVVVLGIVSIFFIAPAKIRALRKKEEIKSDADTVDEEDVYTEDVDVETEAIGARVISKDFESKVNGTKYVRHSSSFFITFLTDDGEEKVKVDIGFSNGSIAEISGVTEGDTLLIKGKVS